MHRNRKRSSGPAEHEYSLVGFRVSSGLFAVDVTSVREILAPSALVTVPQASKIVLGVIEHRGKVVPIVDLRRRFGFGPLPSTQRAKWIVVDIGGVWFGLVADEVTEVFQVGASQERVSPRVGSGDVAQGFSKVFAYDKQIVMVMDLPSLARAIDRDEVLPSGSINPSALEGGSP